MKKSNLVSGMGLGTEFVSNTVKLGRKAGLTDEDLHVLGTDEGKPFIQVMIDALKASLKVNPDSDFEVLVNYDEPLEKKVARLRERGLTFANDDITTEHLPVPVGRNGSMKMSLSFPKLGNAMSTTAAEQFVEQCNLEVGDPYQLLDLLDQYSDRLQKQMTQGLCIVALGVSWRIPGNFHCIVLFYSSGAERELNLLGMNDDLSCNWRLVGSRKVSANA